jgi:transcriptional regulator with PAS, ATPase and Fis domain
MKEVYTSIKRYAPHNAGGAPYRRKRTGKDMVAHEIHSQSGLKGKFVKVHSPALPESLLESELFGYEKGGFTNAHQMKRGHIEKAHDGKLFLNEIGDLPHALQSKLLQVLQGKDFSAAWRNDRYRSQLPLDLRDEQKSLRVNGRGQISRKSVLSN